MRTIDIQAGTTVLPLPMDRVRKLEKYFRVQLPADLLDFLACANFGVPVQRVFAADGRDRLINRFLGIHPDHLNGDLGGYDISVTWSMVDDRMVDDPHTLDLQLLPVAELFAGDLVCLDFRPNSARPSVVVWDHEQSKETAPFVVPVAGSFSEFLELLREPAPATR